MKSLLRPVFIFAIVSFLTGASVQAQNYVVTDLGSLGGSNTYPYAINSSGVIAGISSTLGDTATHAAQFSGTGTDNIDLGTLTGGSSSYAYGINDSGVVVGDSFDSTNTFRQAAKFSGTGNVALGGLGGNTSTATDINSTGTIVGSGKITGNTARHAILFSGTGTGNTDLGGLGGDSQATGINDSGVIVGYSLGTGNSTRRAVLFSGTGTGNTDLGTLGGTYSSATAINATGTIVGSSTISGLTNNRATQFSGTGINNIDLGTLGGNSIANDINASGVIVGSSDTAVNANIYHAFVYRNANMIDLNTLIPSGTTIVLTSAVRINDAGQIIAAGSASPTSLSRSFRLDPVAAPTPTPTPSPTPTPPAVVAYKIRVVASPSSKGTVTGGKTYLAGTRVVVVAKPKIKKVFVNWTESGKIISRSRIYRFTANKARNLVAHFK